MDRLIKIMVVLIVGMLLLLFLPDIYDEFFSDKHEKSDGKEAVFLMGKNHTETSFIPKEVDHWVNDSLYVWDEEQMNWIANGVYEKNQAPANVGANSLNQTAQKEPIKVRWETLMNISYRLRYFDQIQTDMFSPVFGQQVEALDGKEVIVEGFVIPFDEEGELMALSYNPYSSCFFCGNASPASVISMYMRDTDELYAVENFKQFKGTLFLNQDDPDQFYYILKDVIAL